MNTAVRLERVRWPNVAVGLGFAAARGEHVRNGAALRHERGWLALRIRQPFAGDPLRDLLGAPGLWRGLREGARCARVFDLPPVVRLDGEGPPDGEPALAALLVWAEATADGTRPPSEQPPADEVESWIEPGRRHVRAGSHVASIELVADAGRLALAIPALVRIPPDLPGARCAWLAELCHDAQKSWRMVRFGIDEASACVRSEVDLSGVPADLARPLIELGLSALTFASEWALPALALVADPGVASKVLERRPERAAARADHTREEEQA